VSNRLLHSGSHRVVGVQCLLDWHRHADAEVRKAAALLGADQHLVRLLDRAAVVRRQLALTSLALASGAVGVASGATWAAALLLAASLVELVLIVLSAALASSTQDAARELLIDGWGELPLRALDRERQRLGDPRTPAKLARALDRIVDTAAAWPRIQRNARPVFDVRVVRATAPLLTEIAALLRVQPAPPKAVARIERLLTAGGSALYSDDRHQLANELQGIQQQLTQRRDTG
jgi:hypothetical protein